MKIKERDFVIHKKWRTIGRVVKIEGHNVKMRKISTTIMERTHRSGTPYTFQSWTSLAALNKNWKRIGTEDILRLLWRWL